MQQGGRGVAHYWNKGSRRSGLYYRIIATAALGLFLSALPEGVPSDAYACDFGCKPAAPRYSGGGGGSYRTYSGGGGGGGSGDYSSMIGAGIGLGLVAIELLPGLLDTVGNVAGGVADIGSGVVSGVGDVGSGLTNIAAPMADTGATSFNPFNIFQQTPDVPCNENDRKRGCRNIKGNAAAFGTGGSAGDEQYVVDPGGCSANRAVRGGCPKMQPKVTCNDRGCYTEYVQAPPPPKRTKTLRQLARERGRG